MHHPTEKIAHTTAFYTLVVELWLEWKIALGIYQVGTILQPTTPWADVLPLT